MECDLHEMIGCTFCSGKFSTRAKPAKPTRAKKVKAALPEDLRVAEAVAAGKLCHRCVTPFAPIGCMCSRRADFDTRIGDSRRWLQANEGEFIRGDKDAAQAIQGAHRAVTGLAFSSLNRAARRAGLSEDELAADRLDVLQQFAVEPEWHAARNQEGNHLPV